ncbi:L,D-transpeptidase catalytic domain-containing protein, partial [Bifidobacterium margollesii]
GHYTTYVNGNWSQIHQRYNEYVYATIAISNTVYAQNYYSKTSGSVNDPYMPGWGFPNDILPEDGEYISNQNMTLPENLLEKFDQYMALLDASTTYTVSFDPAGGTTVPTQTVKKNAKASQPADPTRSGYSFAGWFNGNTRYDFNTPVTGNLKLVAHWTANTVYRTVSFDSAGGTAVTSQKVVDGSRAVQPKAPTRSGYSFTGWYNGNAKWDFNTPVTSDLKLTARWTAIPPQTVYRTVSFDSAGGSAVASQRVANGSRAVQPKAPTRSGYTFTGWYQGSAKYDFSRPVTGDLKLTARWSRNQQPSKPSKPTVRRVPVYRVYNRNSGLHHYTTSKAENDMLVRLGWRDENRGGSSFVTVGRDTPGARPVYREYNRRSGNHNWTLNKAEHDMLVRLGWRDEGIAWYTSPTGANVYRLYNPTRYHKPKHGRGNGGGEHVYTTSYGEYLSVIRAGWRGEGVAWKTM